MTTRVKTARSPNRFPHLVLVLALAGALGVAVPQSGQTIPKALDDELADTVKEWQIPGAAVVVVKDGRTVATKGYGVRELGKPDRVDADTLFDIASLTKSFTAAAIASMVDEACSTGTGPSEATCPPSNSPIPISRPT
jgi:CubicO group peptidase (beta-lactamase class C family)